MNPHRPPPSPEDSRLVVLIDDHWPATTAAQWALLDRNGHLHAEGHGEVAAWPPAATVEIVLGGWQTSLHDIRLPQGRRGRDPRVLAYAMEDILLQPPATQHLTVVHRQPDGDGIRAAVLAVDRTRLRAVIDCLSGHGRPPRAVFSELELLPCEDGACHLGLRAGTMILPPDRYSAVALDGGVPDTALLATLGLAGAADRTLVVHAAPEAEDTARAIHAALPGSQRAPGEGARWWTATTATSLLHGDCAAPTRSRSLTRRLRLPLALAAVSLAIVAVAELGLLLWERHQLARIESETSRIFAETLPGVPAVLPLAQAERQRDDLRAALGRLREDDLLTGLTLFAAAHTEYPESSIATLNYDRGRLVLELAGIADDALPALRRRLAAASGSPTPAIELLPGADQ